MGQQTEKRKRYGEQAKDRMSAQELLRRLKAHPNYNSPIPMRGESKTDFILRSVAHLISPPQEEGESNEIECVDVSAAVIALGPELEKAWDDYIKTHNH
jgi:hypothetical protein